MADLPNWPEGAPLRKKPHFPIGDGLQAYLRRYRRETAIPVTYERLRGFHEVIPLVDADGKPTLWDTVIYDGGAMQALNEDLKQVYSQLKAGGDLSVMQHLYVDRVDFCTFGNSTPFRIRIVNAYNDNQDYYYVKKADASRVYGLELEHLLSPNRLNFLTHGTTLIEEHIAGVPGDIFIRDWLPRPDLRPIRVAKELVKFNERCFVRLLGDMRAYNFLFVVTPDFEDHQLRIRAMDFDRQSYDGRKNFYLPQFFKENAPLARYCMRHLRPETANQYQREEQSLLVQRADISAERLNLLLAAMSGDPIAPPENVLELREALASHYGRGEYLRCQSMGELVRENLQSIRLQVGSPGTLGGLIPES
jgi:hypothetical protein